MSTGKQNARTGTTENRVSKADPRLAGKRDIEDMEYAINILEVNLQSATSLSEKVRLYDRIKTLQGNISRHKSEG